jgi:hypothetical protein
MTARGNNRRDKQNKYAPFGTGTPVVAQTAKKRAENRDVQRRRDNAANAASRVQESCDAPIRNFALDAARHDSGGTPSHANNRTPADQTDTAGSRAGAVPGRRAAAGARRALAATPSSAAPRDNVKAQLRPSVGGWFKWVLKANRAPAAPVPAAMPTVSATCSPAEAWPSSPGAAKPRAVSVVPDRSGPCPRRPSAQCRPAMAAGCAPSTGPAGSRLRC